MTAEFVTAAEPRFALPGRPVPYFPDAGEAIPAHRHADVHEIFLVLDGRVPPVPHHVPAPEHLARAAREYRNEVHFDARLDD